MPSRSFDGRPLDFYFAGPGSENPDWYQPGGYHPVHLGDVYRERYRVINKLGFGTYSTVWLARDLQSTPQTRYVALKFIVAELTGSNNEIRIHHHLASRSGTHPGSDRVLPLLDHFQVQGPNGEHDVLVLQVIGPHLEDMLDEELHQTKPLAHQIALGISFLHDSGVVHADLHKGNIAFEIPDIDGKTEWEVMNFFGLPKCVPVFIRDQPYQSDSLPKYLVLSGTLINRVEQDNLRIKIIDLGRAFFSTEVPQELYAPLRVRAPEAIFNHFSTLLKIEFGTWVDVWSIGCLIYEMATSDPLVDWYAFNEAAVLRQLMAVLGPLPEEWISSLGESYATSSPSVSSLGRVLSASSVDGDTPELITLLQRILVYDPLQRLDVTDILKHPWFVGPPHPAAPSGPSSEGVPPLSLFTTGKPEPADANQKDPTAVQVATSLGLLNSELEPPPLPFESSATTETNTTTVPLVTRSPLPSISTPSDFTIITSDDEFPIDPTAVAPHETLYFRSGNVEVLCEKTLFRVHSDKLCILSPVLADIFSPVNLLKAGSHDCCPRITLPTTVTDFVAFLKLARLIVPFRLDTLPDFATLSSLLRVTTEYQMLDTRRRLLELVGAAYPESFEGFTQSKCLGESAFGEPIPHPNQVLNLFVQQKLTSALPMAYYMTTRRGLDSLMDRDLPQDATLPPEILRSAMRGFVMLREVEFNGTHSLIFGVGDFHPCSSSSCPSHTKTRSAVLGAHRKVFERIVNSPELGTKILQVPDFFGDLASDHRLVSPSICSICVEKWESGHAELRKKAWEMLPHVFGVGG